MRCLSNSYTRWRQLTLIAGSGLLAPLASALILGGSIAVQPAGPSDDPGWANAVSPNGCSGVYLGNQWVLTAGHVGAGKVTIDSISYSVAPGSTIRLRTPDDSGVTDLAMFRLVADPGLPSIPVISTQLRTNTAVTMIGHGRTRGDSVSYNTNWVLNGKPTAYTGYLRGSAAKNWGTNKIARIFSNNGTRNGAVVVYQTTFTSATANEAQAAGGDSGGGVFAKVDGTWRLAGIMVTVDSYVGQPAGTSIFGNCTNSMELSTYRRQIEAVRALSTGYDIWQYLKFRATATNPTADPDGDGFTNLVEYAYGLDPQMKDAATAAPRIALVAYADGNSLTATFTHNRLSTDVTLAVEVSDDLVVWVSGTQNTAVVSKTNIGGTVDQLVVRDRSTSGKAARRFMRVRVTR